MEYCTECENRCPANALRCDRGRRAFGMESDEGRHGHGGHGYHQMLEGTLGLLQRCSHALHHGKVSDDALDCLTEDERHQLDTLLSKLLENWDPMEK